LVGHPPAAGQAGLSAEFPTFLFCTSVRDLGVILDEELSFAEHITARTRFCYYHLRQLRVISRSLSSSSASTLVHAFIANRLNYCSSLYCGFPQVLLQPLKGVLRADARMIGGVPRFGHITDCMRDVLHWLPVQQRVFYRIYSIVWHCVLGNSPSYLLELFTLTSACCGRRSLRSASKGDFVVPRARNATRQKSAFSIVGSSVWNGLPSEALTFVLCLGTFPVLFINSSRISSLAGPGLEAPLSSYLEGALCKLIYG